MPDPAGARGRFAVAAGLFLLTAASVVILAASKGIFLPSTQPRPKGGWPTLSQSPRTLSVPHPFRGFRTGGWNPR